MLQENRGTSSATGNTTRKRGKKLSVTPGAQIVLSVPGQSELPTRDEPEQQPDPPDDTSDNLCAICKCDYARYHGPDWLQCLQCKYWVCGVCNGGRYKKYFTCEACDDDD